MYNTTCYDTTMQTLTYRGRATNLGIAVERLHSNRQGIPLRLTCNLYAFNAVPSWSERNIRFEHIFYASKIELSNGRRLEVADVLADLTLVGYRIEHASLITRLDPNLPWEQVSLLMPTALEMQIQGVHQHKRLDQRGRALWHGENAHIKQVNL